MQYKNIMPAYFTDCDNWNQFMMIGTPTNSVFFHNSGVAQNNTLTHHRWNICGPFHTMHKIRTVMDLTH